jgi:uncharacterized membrane protein YgcG
VAAAVVVDVGEVAVDEVGAEDEVVEAEVVDGHAEAVEVSVNTSFFFHCLLPTLTRHVHLSRIPVLPTTPRAHIDTGSANSFHPIPEAFLTHSFSFSFAGGGGGRGRGGGGGGRGRGGGGGADATVVVDAGGDGPAAAAAAAAAEPEVPMTIGQKMIAENL